MSLHEKDKNYYKLKLKGIIVHSGGPDVGHYWSIVRKDTSWLKYDDSKVSVFPHSSI
jgi:ubiquitin C-terminal hydrolase